MQAVQRALEEIVLKKRPPAVPKVPKLRHIPAPQPSKPGQRQLELVYVHDCRFGMALTCDCVIQVQVVKWATA